MFCKLCWVFLGIWLPKLAEVSSWPPKALLSGNTSYDMSYWLSKAAHQCGLGAEVEPTLNHFSGRSTGCQWSNESPTKWWRWRSRYFHHRRQHTCMTWSSQLFLFGRCDLPTPHCCLLQEHELNSHGSHSQSQLHTHGTHYRLTLDLATLYTPVKNTSKHTCSDSLNLKPPVPPYPLQDF